tara:strand:+ start:302 stop:1849 length:1548 start_codon:yes stop_codon:yes gene_type:complete
MARFNPYGSSQQISDSINSIAKALIGSPDTDAALARARASDATAGLRNAQARGENIKSDMLSGLYTKGDSLINDPVFQSSVAKMMNLDTFPANEFGPPAQGQVQLGGNTMSNLARVLLGEYGNAETMSKALGNMVTTGQEVGARNVIMDPNSQLSAVARAMDLLGNTRGKYFDEGLAKYEVDESNLTDIEKANIVAKSVVDKANIDAKADMYETDTRYGPDGQGDRTDKAKIQYENYAADAKKQADIKVQELKNTQDGKEAAAKLAAEVKWEQENNVVIEDGFMVFSPEAADAYGITSKVNIETNDGTIEVFAIDTNPPNDQDPNRVAVAIAGGESVIYVDQATLDKIPTENVDGVLTWKEGAATKGESGSTSKTANTTLVGENITQAQETALNSELETKITTALPNLNSGKQMALQTYMIKLIDAKMGKPDSNLAAAKQDIMAPILGGGTHIYRFGKNITVPGYFAQRFDVEYSKYKAEPTPDKLKALQTSVKNTFQNLGYTDDEITRILRNFE